MKQQRVVKGKHWRVDYIDSEGHQVDVGQIFFGTRENALKYGKKLFKDDGKPKLVYLGMGLKQGGFYLGKANKR